MAVPKPDYLSRDYVGLRQSLMQYAQQTFPEWQPASEGDHGVVMLELFAYMGDIISYYTDRAQFENYLPTATQRDSILNLAFMLGYVPNSGTPATGKVPLTTDRRTGELTIPAGMQINTNRVESLDGPITFETDVEVVLPANPNGEAVAVEVAVTEGTTESFQYLGESSGLPGQVLLLPHPGVYRDTIQVFVEDGEGSTLLNEGSLNESSVREWTRVERLLEGDAEDKVFEARFTSRTTNLYFGDDINGAIPATGLKVYATYRHGVGFSGNIGAGLARLLNTKGAQGLGAAHVARDANGAFLSSQMVGGADPESNDSIRFNAPRVYRTQERAVTLQDFEDIALGTEGVTSASVVAGTFTSVTLYITGPDGKAPSISLIEAVLDRFEGKTLAGTYVQIAEPTFVPINFGTVDKPIIVEGRKKFSAKTIRAAVRRSIRAYVASLAPGERVNVGRVYRATTGIDGVASVDVPVMARADDAQTGTVRITPKPWEVFTTGSIFIEVVPVSRDNVEVVAN